MTWTVRLHTIPEDKVKEVEKYCILAEMQDNTFTWEEQESLGKVKYIIIGCVSKDQAFRRGSLFHHRFGCFYEVEWKKS